MVKGTNESKNNRSVDFASSPKEKRFSRSGLQPSKSVANLQEIDRCINPEHTFTERVWENLFAATAILDIISTFLPPLFRQKLERDRALALEEEERKKILPNFLTFWKKKSGNFLDLPQCVDGLKCMYERSMFWMEEHRISIAYIFIICCMIDTARKAYYKWKSELETEKKSSSEIKTCNGAKKEIDSSSLIKPATISAAKTILFRLSILPIGFYTIRLVDHISILTFNASSVGDGSFDASTTVPNQNEDFSSSGSERYSVLFVIILRFRSLLMHILRNQIGALKKVFATKITPKILRFAIYNPRRFKKNLAALLVYLRWIKYLIPLFQKSEKLFKALLNITKIRKQRREASKAKKDRKKKWKSYSIEKKMELSALMIQSQFRAKKAKRDMKLRLIFQTGRNKRISRNIQAILHTRAIQAREKLAKKRIELASLVAKTAPDSADLERSRDLQLELGTALESKQKQKMLLRPDTAFIIWWKFFFMMCVAIEIIQKALEHRFGNKNIMEAMLVPTPIEDWASCTTASVTSKGFLGIFNSSNGNDFVGKSDFPWYCDAPYPALQSTYIHIIEFVISKGLTFMSIVFFFDVFVNFFTGTYDKGGFLVEEQFFPRWIFPGIGFQLLVNPRVKEVSTLVKRLIKNPGPAATYKWFGALIIPLTESLFYWFKWRIWMVVVSRQNKKKA